MSANGGLSGEEFLVLQEQLIALRNRNYELQEALQKKNNEIAQMASPKSEALQFASKLIHRRDKEKEVTQKYEAELDAMRKKLSSQEEEFRLQQETLISELNKIVSQNESMRRELDHFKADGSIYSSPQAGTPCDPPCSITDGKAGRGEKSDALLADAVSSLGTHNLAHETEAAHDTTGDAATPVEQAEVHNVEDNAIVEALENKLLEYKERINQLDDSVKQLSSENAQLLSTIQEKEEKLIFSSEFQKQTDMTSAKKDVFISHALQCISSIKVKLSQDQCCFPDQCLDIDLLDQEISSILGYISAGQAELCKVTEENAAFQQALSAARIEVETLTNKLSQTDETYKKEKAANNEVVHLLKSQLLSQQEAHSCAMQAAEEQSSARCSELREKLAALEKSGDKHIEDRILLLETRFQLKLADREKAFESEREEMHLKLRSLEASLQAKDEEKTLSLKKQAAVIRELKRAAREEKKRAESMEKLGRCCSEERGWHLVGEADGKSAQTLDAMDSRSVSSSSALESDNAELISRLTSLQRAYSDVLDRVNLLENENARLSKEVFEKGELIEHWIKRRPLTQATGLLTPSRPEGALRKFLTSTLTGDEATNDIKEMNKKLQRMLEETLSKNIVLQRDLQTLLERTEM